MELDEKKEITLTVTEFIQRLSKELHITKSAGLTSNLDLIALVKNCQFLYDKNLPDFKDIQKKNEAWEAIGDVFDLPAGDVQLRWKGLRDVFTKYKNKSHQSDDGLGTKLVSCPHYEDLKFLEPHIISRKRYSSNRLDVFQDEVYRDRQITTNLEDIKLFIERIKNTPILYHQKFKGGSNQAEKVEAWREIANTFGIPLSECLTRWRNLRERYAKERRISKTSQTKWELFQDVSFLDEHVKTRKRLSLKEGRMEPLEKKSDLCYVITSSDCQPESVTLNCSSILNSGPIAKKEIDLDNVEFFDVSSDLTSSSTPLFNEENDMTQQSTSPQIMETSQNHHSDEDDLFGKTIAAELKCLACPRKKMKLKAEIFRLLYESCEN